VIVKQAATSKRSQVGSYILLAILSIVSVSFFFGAPVFPVNMSISEYAPHCGSVVHWDWTEWESAGDYLLGVGYHVRHYTWFGCI